MAQDMTFLLIIIFIVDKERISFLFIFLETASHYIYQAVLEFSTLPSQSYF